MIQTDHLIPIRKPDLVLITKKRTCPRVDFAVPADRYENDRKRKKRQVLRPCLRTKEKTAEYESDGYTKHCWCAWNGL